MGNYKTGSQFVWAKYILLIGLAGGCVALAYIVWWSFLQTRDWFVFLDFNDTGYMSLSLAVIFQYMQGPVLFLRGLFVVRRMELETSLRRRVKGTIEFAVVEHELKIAKWTVWGLLGLFILFGSVDAWTNKEQMWAGLDAKKAIGIVVTQDKYFFTALFGMVVVFFEEALGVAFSLASHTFNDIMEIHGRKRIGWLDIFADNARSLLAGGGGGGGGQNKHKGGGGSFQRSGYQRPEPRPVPGPAVSEPTYYTPPIREQADFFSKTD